MKANFISFLSLVLVFHCLAFTEAQDPGVRAFEEKILQARPLPLSKVRLTGGPLKHAQDLTADYLLQLEPDRMLAGYRIRAGLEPKAKGYEGWDAVDSRQLTGHIAGHYLSAVSLMYAATGREEFKQRADYIVTERAGKSSSSGRIILSPNSRKSRTSGAMVTWAPLSIETALMAGSFSSAYPGEKSNPAASTSTACGRRGTPFTRHTPA